MKDEAGDFFKEIEKRYNFKIESDIICVRLDGRSFSKFTSSLPKPYCASLSEAFVKTTELLCKECNAVVGYTQSDEISLILKLNPEKENQQHYFNGNRDKIITSLSALASVLFNKLFVREDGKIGTFDARAFPLSSVEESRLYLKWRQDDCIRNSVNSLYLSKFSHTDALNKSSLLKKSELLNIGIDWNDQPAFFKYGTFLVKDKVPLSEEEKARAASYGNTTYSLKTVYQRFNRLFEIKEKYN